MNAISATALTKTFFTESGEEVHALNSVDLTISSGEFVAVVGPSGSGKSTLLYALCGLESVDEGSVALESVVLSGLNQNELAKLRRERVGFLAQRYNLIPYLTVRENVELTVRLAGHRPEASAVDELLTTLGVGDQRERMPRELSGGQQQRVALARALLTEPAVLLADEPTGALDTRTGDALVDLLRDRASRGATVVMATHNLQNASKADRVLVMRDGRITASLHRPTDRDILVALESVSDR